jgi:hypothetical protein
MELGRRVVKIPTDVIIPSVIQGTVKGVVNVMETPAPEIIYNSANINKITNDL